MPNQLQVNGANPGKQTKAAPIYTGRFFSGINTNRSPLRDARGTRYEEKFIGAAGDALIDGANLEITNRLTLGRRPGNPVYDDVNEWDNILSFDTFRISKALPDIFGELDEQIDIMVSEGPSTGYESGNASLTAITGPFSTPPFQKQVGDPASSPAVWESASPSAGQAYGVQIGNEWYFGNGVDNKKWLQSLFVRNTANDSAILPINTYPFMQTFYIDPNNNIQQLIGAIVQSTDQNTTLNVANVDIESVSISDNILTITVNAPPYNAPGNPPIPIGTQYMIWSADNAPVGGQFGAAGVLGFLQGMTITTISEWVGNTVTASIDESNLTTTTVTHPALAVLQIEQGGEPSNAFPNTVLFGSTVPTWSTQVPDPADNFGGGITIDGQAIWVNRGETVENWGIAAPTGNLAAPGAITTFGAQAGNWQAGTYYSPASITLDSAGNLWLLTKAGLNPGAIPGADFVQPAKKFDIYTVQFMGSGTVQFGTEAVGSSLAIDDTFQVSRLRVTANTALNTHQLALGTSLVFTVTNVAAGSVAVGAASIITATCTSINDIAAAPITGDAGYLWTLPNSAASAPSAPHQVSVYPTAPTSGQAQWTAIQTKVTLVWVPNTHFYEDDFVIQSGDFKMLYKGVQPFIHSLPPSAVGIHTAGGTWPTPVTPVTVYFFTNNSPHPANPSFTDAVGAWPYVGYTNSVSPNPTLFPTTPSLWFETDSAQVQPAGPNLILAGQTGDLYFYYMGGNAFLNIEGSPGVLMPGGAVDSGQSSGYGIATVANIYVPLSGVQMTFNFDHNAGGFFGLLGASLSGPQVNLIDGITSGSPVYGIPVAQLVGTNTRVLSSKEDHIQSDAGTVTFGNTGNFILETDMSCFDGSDRYMIVTIGGTFVTAPVNTVYNLAIGQDLSWPSMGWNGFSNLATATPPPAFNSTTFPNEMSWANPSIDQSGIYYWMDIGPTANYLNIAAGVPMTLSGAGIVYNNSLFFPYTAGISGATVPNSNFASTTTPGVVVADNGGTLFWMYISQSSSTTSSTAGTITALGPQGFVYGIALVNTLDNSVSNLSATNEINGVGIEIVGGKIVFAPGAGLNLLAIDPQADYVAIFRTTANGSIELLVPSNGNTIYTVPLVQYLQYGYVDNTQDTNLDILVQGATAQQNTPPLPGAVNLTYFLNRIWYSVGNTVYYTTGPSDPSGNGIDGTAPGNTQVAKSRVTRLVPSSIGMLVFTLSDVYVIPISNGAILPIQVYVPGLGLSSYDALDVCGTLIGLFTTDHQFVLFTPAVGVDHIGNPIANLLRLDIDEPGMDWNPAKAYVAWYVNGEDVGWFLADGVHGWYRLLSTPAPEKGEAWSPFANINPITTYGYSGQGCGAIKSVEVYPGDHRLLLGPALTGGTDGFGSILYRDLDASTDGGVGEATPPIFPTNNLNSAINFDILAGSAVTGSAGAGSVVSGGNIGISPNNATSVTNFPPSQLIGGIFHYADASALQAQDDLTSAIVYYSGLTPTLSGLSDLSVEGNGANASTFNAGVYVGSSALDIPTTITLDAQGNPQAIFVFIAGSTITLESGASVVLVNGAQAGNVYWVAGTSFTSIWDGIQSNMVGTIMAMDSITLGGGNFEGRALASTGAVTLSTTETITSPNLTPIPASGGFLVNGTTYPAYGVFGSYVCAHPGQVALINFITTDQVNIGSPCTLGVIFDEALPYYQGSFDILKNWVSDPPNLPESSSILGQRFYISEAGDGDTAAMCRHCQIMIQWPAEAALNELQSFTIFGSFAQQG